MRDIIEFLQSRGRKDGEKEPHPDPALFALPPRDQVACWLGEIKAFMKYYPKECTLDNEDVETVERIYKAKRDQWSPEDMRFIMTVYLQQGVYEKIWKKPGE